MPVTVAKTKKKLLFVDDDPAMVKVVERILGNALGPELIEFHEAPSGEKGLKKADELRPDIVICDIHLPGMNGFEFCQKIRHLGLPAIIILMSAYDEDEDYAIQAKEMGADAFLIKPIKKGELLFVVNFVLQIKHLNQTIHDKNKELTERFDSTVGLLTNIIELHQSQRRGHSERVAEVSVFVGRKMKLPQDAIENLRIAARLHELGIVSLPHDETIEEATDEGASRHVTSHPMVADMLLKGFAGFEPISDLIRHMHENVDGSGNPDGLVGDQIPLGSRILSAASFYDHYMVSHPDSSILEVLKKVEQASGTWFDENVVSLLSDYALSQNQIGDEKTISCSVFALKEGMVLASDIYSESGINLLRKGTVLNRDMVNNILKFNNVDPVEGQIEVEP